MIFNMEASQDYTIEKVQSLQQMVFLKTRHPYVKQYDQTFILYQRQKSTKNGLKILNVKT